MKTEKTKQLLSDADLAQVEGGITRLPGHHIILNVPETNTQTGLEDLLGAKTGSTTKAQ